MSRLSFTDRLQVGRLRLTRARGSVAGWRRLPSTVDRLLLVPIDLVTPDPSFLVEARAGQFGLAGIGIDVGHGSPFAVVGADPCWLTALHGFGWLRNLRAEGSLAAVDLARRLVGDWMDRNARAAGLPWQPEIVADRVSAWLSNAGLLLEGADTVFYARVLASLGRQIRKLDAARGRSRPGEPRLRCLTTLLEAVLATGADASHAERFEVEFCAELQQQVLSDGCHVSRNPATTLDLLLKLLPLQQCYRERRRPVPRPLDGAIASMIGFVRRMKLGDGTLARFNGMGRTPVDALATLVTSSEAAVGCANWGTPGGYARLDRGSAIMIVDAGSAPPLEHAGAAHAGCLSFELSVGPDLLIRNCGAPSAGGPVGPAIARATSSHSTLAAGNRSSAQLTRSPGIERLIGAPPLAGPPHVKASVTDGPDALIFEGEHDGYGLELGLLHRRRLAISNDGRRLDGTDQLSRIAGHAAPASAQAFAIHFHLAASVEADADPDGRSVLLRSPAGLWRLSATGARALVETSADYTQPGSARPSRQIVLRGTAEAGTTVSWTLQALD